LGKLYGHRITFPNVQAELHFVSNAYVSYQVAAGGASDLESVCVSLLSAEQATSIVEKLKEEHGLASDPDVSGMHFVYTPLSVAEHSEHAKGRLASFLESLNPGRKHAIGAAYKTLAAEIRRRATREGQVIDFASLSSGKGITRKQFDGLLQLCGAGAKSFEEQWHLVEAALLRENVSFVDLRQIQDAWTRYEFERMDPDNALVQRLREDARGAATVALSAAARDATLSELASVARAALKYNHPGLSAATLRAAILMELSDESPLQAIDPEPKEEAQ